MEKFIKQGKEQSQKKGNNFLAEKKKSIIIGGAVIGFLFVVYLLFGRGGEQVEIKKGVSEVELKATVEEVTKPLFQKQKQMERQIEETNKNLNELTKNLSELVKVIKEKEEKKPELPPVPSGGVPQMGVPSQVVGGTQKPVEKKPKLRHISIQGTVVKQENKGMIVPPQVAEQVKKKKEASVYIPAGSIVEGRLMYGFVAPESGMFPPVLVEFTKPIRTANNYFIPARKCLVTTSAQYDISQGLAILGGLKSTLSCVMRNGQVIEIPVNIAVGEEIKGKTVQIGLSGEEKWLTAEDFAKISSMGTIMGMSSSMQQSLAQQSMTPQGNVVQAIQDRGLYSVLGGVQMGTNKFFEFWMRKYDKKVPAILVKPNKRIFVVFVQGVDLKVSEKEFEL